jgi:multiple sugar transport system substrate-binding protein
MLSSFIHIRKRCWPVYPGIFAVLFVMLTCTFFISGCSEKKVDNKVAIHFVTWKPNQTEVWDEIVGIFEREHPGLRVQREVGPHSSTAFHDLLTQKLKNRSRDVDVFFMDVIWPPEFAAAGWALPLDERFPDAERKRFLKGTIMANTYQGKIFGVPLFIDSGMLFYRKDLLEKYGFVPPSTWEEMVAQAKTIVSGESSDSTDIAGFSGQFKQYEGLVCNMLEYILSNRGFILDPETGKPLIAERAAVDAVRFVRDNILGQIAPEGVLTYEEPESIALFLQGKAVFHRNWPYAWEVSNDPDRSKIAGRVGVTKLPYFPGGQSHSALGGWQLGISPYSEKKDAAWTFISFLTSERIQKMLALKAGLAPTREQLYQDQEILSVYPQFAHMKEVFLTAYPRPRSALYPSVSHVLQRYFSKVISDPDSRIEDEAKAASGEIARIQSIGR